MYKQQLINENIIIANKTYPQITTPSFDPLLSIINSISQLNT